MMRHFIVFLLISVSNFAGSVQACGPYYPYGEGIRFMLFTPTSFEYKQYSMFQYSGDLYNEDSRESNSQEDVYLDSNIKLWLQRCKAIPSAKDAYTAVYELNGDLEEYSTANSFVSYLRQNQDTAAIRYLNFAKKCSYLNSFDSDPWERDAEDVQPMRNEFIKRALGMANQIKDEDLRVRYAFLALRLLFYSNDAQGVEEVYQRFFEPRTAKNSIDYWSLYFRTMPMPQGALRNYYIAQLFSKAPSKRFRTFTTYNRDIPTEKVLACAQNKEEKAAVWALVGLKKTDRTLDIIKSVYALNSGLESLGVLLLREVNKLEDWIYTPYYTNFSPALEATYYENAENEYPAKRIEADRTYAAQVLAFANTVDVKRVHDPSLWLLARVYLNYMVGKYELALTQIEEMSKQGFKTPQIKRQSEIIKVVCLTAMSKGLEIDIAVKPILMREYLAKNNKLVFAVARELEYKGNSIVAALLLSKLNPPAFYDEEDRNRAYWKTKPTRQTLSNNFYNDYFYYLDAQYTASQVNDLINKCKNTNAKDAFTSWLYAEVRHDLSRLYDLLGTKHIRQNNLKQALVSFKQVNDSLWTSTNFAYVQYLDANPFYANLYSEHKRNKGDTITFTKVTLTSTLIDYLQKANDATRTDRDYYCFLVANCYYNMTQYGNSWLMRRYFWSTNLTPSYLSDDKEYYQCELAKTYYLKAKEASKNEKFAALCLRMAGKCEKFALRYEYSQTLVDKSMLGNKFYKRLEQEYPEYSADLLGNCESFDAYFAESRR